MENLQTLLPDAKPEEIAQLQAYVRGFDDTQIRSFAATYLKQRKSAGTIILLSLLLGWLGGHYWYLGNTGMAILYLLTGGLLFIGSIIDCFRAGSLALKHNLSVAATISRNIR